MFGLTWIQSPLCPNEDQVLGQKDKQSFPIQDEIGKHCFPLSPRVVQLCCVPSATVRTEAAASCSCQLKHQVGPETPLVVPPKAHQGTYPGCSLTSVDGMELNKASQGPTFSWDQAGKDTEPLSLCHSSSAHTRCHGTLWVLNQFYWPYDLIDLVRPDKKSIGKKYMYLPGMCSLPSGKRRT